MSGSLFVQQFAEHPAVGKLQKALQGVQVVHLLNERGSILPILLAQLQLNQPGKHLVILENQEEAAYFFNDLENLLEGKNVLYYPASYNVPYKYEEETKNANVIQRAEVLAELSSNNQKIVVAYPEALSEKVITRKTFNERSFKVHKGEQVNMDFLIDLLFEYEFTREQFVVEPGQFAVRGGIIDLWSFSSERPYRLEFFDDEVESIRSFDPADQLSINRFNHVLITPNVENHVSQEVLTDFLDYLGRDTVLWVKDTANLFRILGLLRWERLLIKKQTPQSNLM